MEVLSYSIDIDDVLDFIKTDATEDEMDDIRKELDKEKQIEEGIYVIVPSLEADIELNDFLTGYKKKYFIND